MLTVSIVLLVLVRVCVLLCEALAEVSSERGEDIELLELCKNGYAKSSIKMRSACLQATSERASPVLLKAVTRACLTAWNEIVNSLEAPSQTTVLMICSFSLVAFYLFFRYFSPPYTPYVRPGRVCEEEEQHIVLLNDFSGAPRRKRNIARDLVYGRQDFEKFHLE